MTTPKFRRPLNKSQIEILQILYKFRFATIKQITKYQRLSSHRYTYIRLANLVDQGYIGKNYSGEYKIKGKDATYYLKKDGIRQLIDNPDTNKRALKGMYRDSSVSDNFIERCLTIFDIYNKLIDLHGDSLEYYTKSELSGDEEFDMPLPDGYLEIKGDPYVLELINPNLSYKELRYIILKHVKNSKTDIWRSRDYPTMLLICPSPAIERRVKIIADKSFSNYDSSIELNTTTLKALLGAKTEEDEIWS